jgi:hypothetical protein
MPRVRFSRIRYTIDFNKKIGVDISANEKIKAFKAFRAGDSDYTAKQPKRLSSRPVSLIPFCVNGYTIKYISGMSGRAYAAMANAGVSEARLNIDAGSSDAGGTGTAASGKKQAGYNSAKAIVKIVPSGGTETSPKSQILQLEYKRQPGVTYNFPFGKQDVAGQRTEIEMRGYILADVARGTRTVNFTPERPA